MALRLLVPQELQPALQPILVTDEAGLSQVEAYLQRTSDFSLDIETNVTDEWWNRKIRTIQLGDRTVQYIIDLLAFAGSEQSLICSQGNYGRAADLVLGPVIRALRPAFQNEKQIKVGYGLQFEYENFRFNLGIRLHGMHDLMLGEKVLHCGEYHFMLGGFWAMEDCVGRYTGLEMGDTTTGKSFDLKTPLTDVQVQYCALDVRLPLSCRPPQTKKLQEQGLWEIAQVEFDVIGAFGDMHLNGMLISAEAWKALINRNTDQHRRIIEVMDSFLIPIVGKKGVTEEDKQALFKFEEVWRNCPSKTIEEKEARKLARIRFYKMRSLLNEKRDLEPDCEGEANINYGSNKQLKEVLWKMGFTKTELPDTNDRTLEKLAEFRSLTVDKAFDKDANFEKLLGTYKLIDLVRLYRSTGKLLSTYGDAWLKFTVDGGHVCPFTGRVHSNINQLGAETGRTSSSSPNVQNLPKDPVYRAAFIARPGYKLLTVDFNGCELRILTELSQEKIWLEAFLKGWDVHSVGAEILFGQEWIDAAETGCAYYAKHQKCKCKRHKELRDQVKAVNFGLAYGMQAGKLADEVGITYEDAEELLARYKHSFPTVTKYLEESGKRAASSLEMRTIAGRRRKWNRPSWESAIKKALLDLKKYKSKSINPTNDQIRKKYKGMYAAIEREGKNAEIQGTNADMAKLAGYLIWLEMEFRFPGASFYCFVHDEWVIECPNEYAEECFKLVSDCMTKAGARWVKSLPMTTEGNIADHWKK